MAVMGRVAVVRDPDDAAADSMPKHAMMAVTPDHPVTLPQLFIKLSGK